MLGRLHPLLVHLPIGILLMAFLFELLSRIQRYRKLKSAVRPALFIGALSAVAAAFTGYTLSQEGGYDERLLRIHQYMGIGLAVFSVLVWFHRRYSIVSDKANRKTVRLALFFVLVGMTIVTGHFGGSLTHGADYLFEAGAVANIAKSTPRQVVDPLQADVFDDVIKPVLEQKCYGCHSARKQKGQLRLDARDLILKGGKHGVALISGKPDESEICKRITIPLEVEHHMPPREREQLTLAEIELLHWWIGQGAPFDKKVGELQERTEAVEFLSSRQEASTDDYLLRSIAVVDESRLLNIRKAGFIVLPIATASNYCRVTIMGKSKIPGEKTDLLKSISSNLVELEITGCQLSADNMKAIGELRELRKLSLRNSVVPATGIKVLASLEKLAILNLTSTGISDDDVAALGGLHSLRKAYLYQTAITKKGIDDLRQLLPALQIDTGNYHLPFLPSDTTILRRKK